MRGIPLGALIVAAATVTARAPHCQEAPALKAGAHVRITAPSLGWQAKTADVADVRGDTLLLRRAHGLLGLVLSPQPLPLGDVTALEVSLTHDAHTGATVMGAVLGGVGGGFAGYAIASGKQCSPGLSSCGFDRMGNVFVGTLLGGTLGAGLGVLITGALVPERWAPIGVPRPHVTVSRLPGRRWALGASLAF